MQEINLSGDGELTRINICSEKLCALCLINVKIYWLEGSTNVSGKLLLDSQNAYLRQVLHAVIYES